MGRPSCWCRWCRTKPLQPCGILSTNGTRMGTCRNLLTWLFLRAPCGELLFPHHPDAVSSTPSHWSARMKAEAG